jgi:hypothetical protein
VKQVADAARLKDREHAAGDQRHRDYDDRDREGRRPKSARLGLLSMRVIG